MRVSVIIPTYKDWPRLSLCITTLQKQSFREDFEIIIVNNAPKDPVPSDFVIPDNCKILNEEKSGSYAARNRGLKEAKGEILAFTDSDCIPDKDWLKNGVDVLKHNDVNRIGGAVKIFTDPKPRLAEIYDLVFAFPQQGYVEDMGWAVTANLFVTKELVNDIGDFNANIKSGGDYEWGIRALEKGYPIIYAGNVMVNHPARKSLKELLKKAKRVREGIEDKKFDEGHLEKDPDFKRKWYVVFRPRFYELEHIKKSVFKHNLKKIYIYKLLFLRNLVLGYGDFYAFKRRKKLNNIKNAY